MVLKVGIIGCGVIGTRRANIIKSQNDSQVIAVADKDINKAKNLGVQLQCEYFNKWQKIIANNEIEAVVISTTNNLLAKISYEAVLNKKHILCEKPLGINIDEVEKAVTEASKNKVVFKAGLTLRFHPGIQKIKSVLEEDLIGKILFIRCRYGITGRPGYEKEWRCDPQLAGGGELIDQGIHVIDLFRWFISNIQLISGYVGTLYWNTAVEDNAFALFSNNSNQIASLHVSWTQWNNIFSLEIFGEEGYIIMEGLGGAYGAEKVVVGKKAPPDKWPPEETIFTYDDPQICWEDEWKDFVSAIKDKKDPCGSGKDGLEALKHVFRIYSLCKET